MVVSGDRQKIDGKTNILDLAEQIFLGITRHLELEVSFFTMRNVCQKVKHCVDAYMQLKEIFILA